MLVPNFTAKIFSLHVWPVCLIDYLMFYYKTAISKDNIGNLTSRPYSVVLRNFFFKKGLFLNRDALYGLLVMAFASLLCNFSIFVLQLYHMSTTQNNRIQSEVR